MYTANECKSDFAVAARCLISLAFVPATEVTAVFEKCQDKWADIPMIGPLVSYFEVFHLIALYIQH